MRHKVDAFMNLTAALVKPPLTNPKMFRGWGDDEAYSLQLGRGECAA